MSFSDRSSRSKYIANRFKSFLIGRILDVDCDKAIPKHLLPGVNYTGIDIAGNPNIKPNLEDIDNLPFDSESFDCVVCSDALEHLDNLHHIFSELTRVAKRYIIISLPNNWVNARRPIGRGKGSIGHYGLPVETPHDRHKWFFSMTEAIDFIRGQEKGYPVLIRDLYVTEKPKLFIIRALRRILYLLRERYFNRYAHTLWIILEKKHSAKEA